MSKLPRITKTSFGDVEYRPAKIRGAMAHGYGELKVLTLPFLDRMFKNGVLYDSHKEGNFTYYNVAHMLKYQGDDYIVRLVAREDQNGNLFYDHEFTDMKKVGASATEREGTNGTTSPHQLFAKIVKFLEDSKLSFRNIKETNGERTKDVDNPSARLSVVEDRDEIERLEKEELVEGYRNVVMNAGGDFGSPMAGTLGNVGRGKELDGNGNDVEINNISSIHSKNAIIEISRLAKLGEDGLKKALRWVEKEKVLNWFGIADLFSPIHTDNPELSLVAKVVQDHKNPKIYYKKTYRTHKFLTWTILLSS